MTPSDDRIPGTRRSTPIVTPQTLDPFQEQESLLSLHEASVRGFEILAANTPLEETLTAIARLVEQQAPDLIASVQLIDANGRLRHAASPSLPEPFARTIDGIAIGPQVGSCGTAAYRREPVIVEDIATDPLWEPCRELALAFGLRACWSTPILDAAGEPHGTFAFYVHEPRRPTTAHQRLIDIAVPLAGLAIARHREHLTLARSEARFRTTFERADVGLAQVLPDGHVLLANRKLAEITGYDIAELETRAFGDLTHPEDLPGDLAQFRRLMAGALTQYHVEKRYIQKDGTPIWVNVATSLVRHATGEPDYVIVVVEDINHRRSLEAQLRQSQKIEAVGLLAGGIAHDFNNVLSVILGLGELSREQLDPADPLRDDMQAIVDAASRGAEITRQLLAFARKDAARPIVLDVNRNLEALRRMLIRLIGDDIVLKTTLAPDLWPVNIDPTQMDQIIINLITNARDAMAASGTVRIETRNVVLDEDYRSTYPDASLGEHVLVEVSDTGIGMDTQTQEQIFAPFFTTKERGTGTGLGLPVVLGICQQAGGHVTVTSAPGAGATFRLYFPRSHEQIHGVPVEKTRYAQAGSETVLVVEDEPAILSLARRTLESHGYRVLPAANPGEALLLAETHRGDIALLLTDMTMPLMTGREVAERILRLRPKIKVLYMSGHPASVFEGANPDTRATAYIPKPFSPLTLAQRVRLALDNES
jgi:PAS domain S-box-containing protein